MTIRSTVKKVDRYGIQGSTSFDPKHPNANIALYRELESFLSGDYGLGGSGGQRANMIKDPRGYQASHVFNTPSERDAVIERLQKQLEEFYPSKIGKQAKAAGMSSADFLRSQGIQPIQYQPDDFILASQNPLRSSVEKKIKAFMSMAGNTQSISGGTGEHRRHTGYYRPNDLKHVRSMLNTEARKLREGTGNLGEMEGLYLPASQKLEARTAQNIFKNGLTEDLLNNEKHPVVEKIRSDMLKQHAMTQLKSKVEQGLKDEGLLPQDEEKKEKKSGRTIASKAMEAAAIVTNKILNVAGDLKSLFTAAVGYLQSIASEIGGLKQDSATLALPMKDVLTEKYMGKFNKAYAANENVFVDSLRSTLNVTANPSRLSSIKWDDAVLHGQAGLIRPIVDAAVDGKINPKETRNKIFNKLAAAYFNPKLKEKERRQLRANQMLALESIFDSSMSNAYQATTDIATAYGLGKNRYDVMGGMYNLVNNNMTKSTIYESLGLTKESGLGSEKNIKALNDFTASITALEEAIKKFTMVHFDDIARAMQELALALLKFLAWFDKDGTAAKLADVLERRMKFTAKDDRKELTRNMTIIDRALRRELEKARYTGTAAEEIINEGIAANTPEEIMERLLQRKGSPKEFNEEAIRRIFILSAKNRKMHKELLRFDLADPNDKTSIDSYDLENEGDNNSNENIVLYNYLKNKAAVQPGELKNLIKDVGEIKDRDLIQKSKAPLSDEQLRKQRTDRYKKSYQINQAPRLFELDPLMKHTFLSRALSSAGSFLNGGAQDKQTIAVDNTVRLIIKDKEIILRNDNATNDKKNIFYAEIG
jgi:hypothetical protein